MWPLVKSENITHSRFQQEIPPALSLSASPILESDTPSLGITPAGSFLLSVANHDSPYGKYIKGRGSSDVSPKHTVSCCNQALCLLFSTQ